MQEYNKLFVAVIGAVVAILATAGIDIAPEISTAVVTLLTALAVFLVPNEPGPADFESQDREQIGE